MGACVLGVTAQVGFRVGYDIPKNVALLRSVSVNLAELRRAQTRVGKGFQIWEGGKVGKCENEMVRMCEG